MKDIMKSKTMTLREVAKAIGASYRTIADYAQRAGWTENGKKTVLDERQVTIRLALQAPCKAPKHHNRLNYKSLYRSENHANYGNAGRLNKKAGQ